MKRLIEKIIAYVPTNKQEQVDKHLMLSYVDLFPDVITRNNVFCHFTSSGFILNETCTKALMVHHNIFKTYSWVGGHLDGNPDCLAVAQKEALEETGLKRLKILSPNIISLDILPVIGHFKSKKYITPHLHLSLGYLFMATEGDDIRAKRDENSDVKWLPLDELEKHISEKHMLTIYQKIIEKVRFLREAPF